MENTPTVPLQCPECDTKQSDGVTSMLMRFWSEISRMFLSMSLGLIILRLKNEYSIALDNLQRLICHKNQPTKQATNQPNNQPTKQTNKLNIFLITNQTDITIRLILLYYISQRSCSSHRSIFSRESMWFGHTLTNQRAERIDPIYLSRTFSSSPLWKSIGREHSASSEEKPLSRPLLRTFKHGRSLKIRGYFLPATQTNQPCGLPHQQLATVTHLGQTEDNDLPATPKRTFSHSDSSLF